MPGNLSLDQRTSAFYAYFLTSLMYNFLIYRRDCAMKTYRNFYLLETIVRKYGRFVVSIQFPMHIIKKQ
jgi:hypothetical protein